MSGEQASREVVHGDALDWLRAHPQAPGCSLVTSLPDKAELGLPVERWRPFFVDGDADGSWTAPGPKACDGVW